MEECIELTVSRGGSVSAKDKYVLLHFVIYFPNFYNGAVFINPVVPMRIMEACICGAHPESLYEVQINILNLQGR